MKIPGKGLGAVYDGNAALKIEASEEPMEQTKVHEQARKRPESIPIASKLPKAAWKPLPLLVTSIFVVAAIVVVTLMSYAQLVMVNDQAVSLRNNLNELKSEETKLMAQYELAYDLQEIEAQMLSSGQMNKIQSWQTYTLELAEPDQVEYYQGSGIKEKVVSFAKDFVNGVKEYF